MKIFLIIWQWQLIVSDPGIVDSPEIRRREKATSASTFSRNSIKPVDSYDYTTSTPSTSSTLQTFKITHDDVVLGANSIYGSNFQPSSPQQTPQNGGGILFAVSGHQGPNQYMSDQFDDMQYQGMTSYLINQLIPNYFHHKSSITARPPPVHFTSRNTKTKRHSVRSTTTTSHDVTFCTAISTGTTHKQWDSKWNETDKFISIHAANKIFNYWSTFGSFDNLFAAHAWHESKHVRVYASCILEIYDTLQSKCDRK